MIIGVGNEMRSDDGVGQIAVRRLRELLPSSVGLCAAAGDGASLMEAWNGCDLVILIDAVSANGEPGMVYRLDARKQNLPSDFFHYSSHAFSVAEAVELARALVMLPPKLVVYGVEGKHFNAGVGLSPEVEAGLQRLIGRVTDEVHAYLEDFDAAVRS